MKYKYEDWIGHLIMTILLIILWFVMFKSGYLPKEFSKKSYYAKGLSFRFYVSGIIIVGLVYVLVRDFIKLHNQ